MIVYPRIHLGRHRPGGDDLREAVPIQIRYGDTPQLAARRFLRPTGFEVTLLVVHGEITAAVGRDDLQLPIPVDIRQNDPRPGAPGAACARFRPVVSGSGSPLQCPRLPIQGHDRVSRTDHLRLGIPIQVGRRRRRVPPRFAPGAIASTALPLKHRRLDRLSTRGTPCFAQPTSGRSSVDEKENHKHQ